jgi:hypothetical protein
MRCEPTGPWPTLAMYFFERSRSHSHWVLRPDFGIWPSKMGICARSQVGPLHLARDAVKA